ncbi:hypothetical protein [Natrinema sp. SYSU A 869]|uniref:hypothetical protein n=1 Tax=Natrinema sp. SYSU A 869 TaxID=2871694 RepID=UPI001CA3898B|nr:hypothetical protein [Natrinema sp. SYSU A 869]
MSVQDRDLNAPTQEERQLSRFLPKKRSELRDLFQKIPPYIFSTINGLRTREFTYFTVSLNKGLVRTGICLYPGDTVEILAGKSNQIIQDWPFGGSVTDSPDLNYAFVPFERSVNDVPWFVYDDGVGRDRRFPITVAHRDDQVQGGEGQFIDGTAFPASPRLSGEWLGVRDRSDSGPDKFFWDLEENQSPRKGAELFLHSFEDNRVWIAVKVTYSSLFLDIYRGEQRVKEITGGYGSGVIATIADNSDARLSIEYPTVSFNPRHLLFDMAGGRVRSLRSHLSGGCEGSFGTERSPTPRPVAGDCAITSSAVFQELPIVVNMLGLEPVARILQWYGIDTIGSFGNEASSDGRLYWLTGEGKVPEGPPDYYSFKKFGFATIRQFEEVIRIFSPDDLRVIESTVGAANGGTVNEWALTDGRTIIWRFTGRYEAYRAQEFIEEHRLTHVCRLADAVEPFFYLRK